MDLHVFDLDGTLTKYGFDLWMLTTQSLVTDEHAFQQALEIYLASKDQETAYQTANSLIMMQHAIALLPENPAHLIRETAAEITLEHERQDDFIYKLAISTIKDLIVQGKRVVISSANYLEGVEGFLQALLKMELLTRAEIDCIEVHATLVDWSQLRVNHLNVGVGKVQALNHEGNGSLRVYGDDIVVNDRALMDLAGADVRVVKNHKHHGVVLPSDWQFITWGAA